MFRMCGAGVDMFTETDGTSHLTAEAPSTKKVPVHHSHTASLDRVGVKVSGFIVAFAQGLKQLEISIFNPKT